MSNESESRRHLLSALFLGLLILTPTAAAETPPDLDAVVEAFKRLTTLGGNEANRLELAYRGLDLYAPVPEKSKRIDTEDRDALCEMKRVVLLDALRQVDPAVVVTACGSTGRWLIEPSMIQNGYDGESQVDIARSKHKGFYMEGLSDLDFMLMGPGARQAQIRVEEILSVGHGEAGLDDGELEDLEISFMTDPQIRTLDAAGDSQRLWRQLLRVEESSPHPEKYITKGGKALYGVDHLEERGAALVPGPDGRTMSFDAWSDGAGHQIGPFTVQYTYGGCADMDYFMRHALEKTRQLPVKTVMQVVKYLERQAWMLERAAKNRDKLPGELTLREDHVDPLTEVAADIRAFCKGAIAGQAWADGGAFARFTKEAMRRSGDACKGSHDLVVSMGEVLLGELEDGELTLERARFLAEIAYDVETVHIDRYPHGRPGWYGDSPVLILQRSEDFLRDYKNLRPRQYDVFVEAGVLVPEERLLAETEIGPIQPPPIATISLEKPVGGAAEAATGSQGSVTVNVTVKGAVEGLLEEAPDWKKGWFTTEQVEAMSEVAGWSWMASTHRMQLEHLERTLTRSRPQDGAPPEEPVYVSHYEINDLVAEIARLEEYAADAAARLGSAPPEVHTDRVKVKTLAASTLSAPLDYLDTLVEQCRQAQETIESLQTNCDRIVTAAEKAAEAGIQPDSLRGVARTLGDLKESAGEHLDAASARLGQVEHWAGVATSLRDAAKGDVQDLAGKVSDLTVYLEELAVETEEALESARDLRGGLDRGVDLFRTAARSVEGDDAEELRDGLLETVSEWDEQGSVLSSESLPALEERAVWLRRGAWASNSVRLALDTVSKVQEYRKAHEALAWSNLSEEMSESLLGLKACGDVICWVADKIPITVLRQVIKDYASLLQRMPEVAIAFDRLVSSQRQDMGYNLRLRHTVHRGYLGLVESRPDLNPTFFFRDMGPFALAGKLHVLGHPEGTAEVDASGRSLSRKLPDLGSGQFWFVWKPTSSTGFLRLDPETYGRANRYVAWFQRLYGKPIKDSELHDLLTRGGLEGSYWRWRSAVSVAELEKKARTALKLEGFGSYLAALIGREDLSPDELFWAYALLNQAARRLGEEGFLLRPRDAQSVMARVHERGGDSVRSWSKTFEDTLPAGLPLPSTGLTDSLDATSSLFDSLSSGKQRRMEEAVAALVTTKKDVREEARKRSWEEARETGPAGLLVDDVRLAVEHGLYWKGGKRTHSETLGADDLDPTSRAFVSKASFDVPEDAKGPAIYVCRVTIRPYAASRVTRHLLVPLTEREEPEPDPDPGPITLADQGCPVPSGAVLHDEPGSLEKKWLLEVDRRLPKVKVGPFKSWWDRERNFPNYEACYSATGRQIGTSRQYYRTGKLMIVRERDDEGRAHGTHLVYSQDGVTLLKVMRYANGKREGHFKKWKKDADGVVRLVQHHVFANDELVEKVIAGDGTGW